MSIEENWAEVLETQSLQEASLIKAVLEEHYIPAVVLNRMSSAYNSFGLVAVLVPGQFLEKAKALLKGEQTDE